MDALNDFPIPLYLTPYHISTIYVISFIILIVVTVGFCYLCKRSGKRADDPRDLQVVTVRRPLVPALAN
jgi:hypothetical protein